MKKNIFKNKKVLITGASGFKGSWLSIWLNYLGANVIGYSAYFPSKPCNFSVCGLKKIIRHIEGDVRNYAALKKVFMRYNPEIVFHLAAQPIVSESYKNPMITFETNLLGTVNVLECIRHSKSARAAVIITSDKCYKNQEWNRGYRENDILGGEDPYSSSKACAELAFHSYCKSYFPIKNSHCRLASARAGNVIGGGDWNIDRLIPDCVKSWSNKKAVFIRNPNATRPWQHVLEPVSGYIWLAHKLFLSNRFNSESFNFGPNYRRSYSVKDIIQSFSKDFGGGEWKHSSIKKGKETHLLKLSCKKAKTMLNWRSVLDFDETIKFTAQWYREYYSKKKNMLNFTLSQIGDYIKKSKGQKLLWTN
ncbi:CDP-glucose 4,6-dehydratase [Candidatus Omnitrophota bacterium]